MRTAMRQLQEQGQLSAQESLIFGNRLNILKMRIAILSKIRIQELEAPRAISYYGHSISEGSGGQPGERISSDFQNWDGFL
ncbi:hypothetical protein LTR97_006633 [Elasticomyces elasticus]|uniref:Uncharacterized protein n=1 Tax=Elasticomyces elasticus TaxID=574655 RepID=A0AAN7VQY3_9PEZI|nr:hypothetical protein LTR97_006633 [Elasticomyces elasticus]